MHHWTKLGKNVCFGREELKYCVLIIATVKSVPYFHRNRTINVQRKKPQTCFCFTPHNSQGST